jgi:alpha-galactosidase
MPRIGRDLLLTPSLAGAEYVLLDIDRQAGDLAKAFLDKLARQLNVRATFASTDDRPAALSGAHYVIITITTGGLAAMTHDLAIPEDYGIYHTVGDTAGPGGWARLIRNFDTFVSLARDISRLAPGAVVLNYTNPMTMLTDVLTRLCTGPVIGLCHGLFENVEILRAWYGLASEQDVALDYAGLNHFFWVTRARAATTDAIAVLTQRLTAQSFSHLMQSAYAGQPQANQKLEVATELFRLTGVLPYLGDRHICEFFPCYITSYAAIEKYKLVRTTVAERAAGAERLRRELVEMVRGEIGPAYAQRTREAAADIIDAHAQGRVFIDVGNVPNIGQINNLQRGLVVETAVRVDRNGFSPVAFGDLPPTVKGFVDPYATLFPLAVDACFRRDKRLALQALRLDPVCAHLSGAQVVELGERLIAAHRPYITAF